MENKWKWANMENNHSEGKFSQHLGLVNFVDSQMWKNPTVAARITNLTVTLCYGIIFQTIFQEENPHQ